MLQFDQLKQDLQSLPETDQQLVIDFVEILKKRHKPSLPSNTILDLENEPFVGMWTDNPEMQDSTAWVRKIRQQHWNS